VAIEHPPWILLPLKPSFIVDFPRFSFEFLMIFPLKPPFLAGHFPAEAGSKIQAEALELQLLPIDDSQNRTRCGPFCIPAMKPPGMTTGDGL